MTKIDFFDKPALITELEANLWEFWSTFGRGPGCTLHDEGDALWFENPIPIMPYCYVSVPATSLAAKSMA